MYFATGLVPSSPLSNRNKDLHVQSLAFEYSQCFLNSRTLLNMHLGSERAPFGPLELLTGI
eukprot:10910787-Alexandrium_andersonii.AAC.1